MGMFEGVLLLFAVLPTEHDEPPHIGFKAIGFEKCSIPRLPLSSACLQNTHGRDKDVLEVVRQEADLTRDRTSDIVTQPLPSHTCVYLAVFQIC
eukprot:760873-Amphidinium_carterae.2